MTTTVQKWGNSLALRIPASLGKDAHLHKGSLVDLVLSKGKIVLVLKKTKKYNLAEMVKKINKNNIHAEIDWGAPRGKEVW